MTDDLQIHITVPEAELEPPAWTPPPSGAYRSLFEGGARVAQNDAGTWKAIVLPFTRHVAKDGKTFNTPERPIEARFTVAGGADFDQPRLVAAAAAFGFAEVAEADGGNVYTLSGSVDEIIENFNAFAGTEFDVFIRTGPRIRKNKAVGGVKEIHYKSGAQLPVGTPAPEGDEPWIDSEIRSIRVLKEEE